MLLVGFDQTTRYLYHVMKVKLTISTCGACFTSFIVTSKNELRIRERIEEDHFFFLFVLWLLLVLLLAVHFNLIIPLLLLIELYYVPIWTRQVFPPLGNGKDTAIITRPDCEREERFFFFFCHHTMRL